MARAATVRQAAPPAVVRPAHPIAALIAAGVCLLGLFAAFLTLYVNFPSGHQVPYGLSLASVPLFRNVWAYPTVSVEPSRFSILALLTIAGLWVVYLGACLIVQRWTDGTSRRRAALVVAGFGLAFHLLLALAMPPVLSADVYNYARYGRMLTLYQMNPYAAPGTAMADDAIWPLVAWPMETSRYGPVWTLISAGAAAVGGQSVLLTVMVLKSAAALFSLASGSLIFLLARRLGGGDGVDALVLYLWNPLVLLESAGSGHNDAAMLCFALLGLLLVVRGQTLGGVAVLLLSVLVKYVSGILLVFVVLHALAARPTWRRRAALAGKIAGVSLVVVGGLYAPFLAGRSGPLDLVRSAAPTLNAMPNPLRILLVERAPWPETYGLWGLNLGFAGLLLVLARGAWTKQPDWPRIVRPWSLSTIVYVLVVYGAGFPWLLTLPLASAFLAPRDRGGFRLRALAIGSSIVLTMLYAEVVAVP